MELWSITFTYSTQAGLYVQQEVFRTNETAALKVCADIKPLLERLGMKFFWSHAIQVAEHDAHTLEDYIYEEMTKH